MNVDEAIAEHAEWKSKFRAAIVKQDKLDTASIGRDDRCSAGKWLHGEGKERFFAKYEFTKTLENHRVFHVEASKVAQLLNARRYDEAEKAIGMGTSYDRASKAVAVSLLSLKKFLEA